MSSNQTILIISLILLLARAARAARAYDPESNESYPPPGGPCLPALQLLALTTVTVLRSERSLLRGPPAPPTGTVRLFAIPDHHKMELITFVIIFSTILSTAQLKKTAKTLRTKARPRTTATEVITVAIWMMTTLGTVTAAVAIKVTRPTAFLNSSAYQTTQLNCFKSQSLE